MPHNNASLDLVTALAVLDYLGDLDHAFAEILRVMTDDTVLLVRCFYPKFGPGYPTLYKRRIDEKAWIKELQRRRFQFMSEMTNDNYPILIREWLERALNNGRGYRYEIGRRIFRIPKFGEWIVTKHVRSRVGLMFFKARSQPHE